jgi:hypothetical protein
MPFLLCRTLAARYDSVEECIHVIFHQVVSLFRHSWRWDPLENHFSVFFHGVSFEPVSRERDPRSWKHWVLLSTK